LGNQSLSAMREYPESHANASRSSTVRTSSSIRGRIQSFRVYPGANSPLYCGRPELCRHVRAGKHRCYLLHKSPPSRLHITIDREAHRVHGDPPDLGAKMMRQMTRVAEYPCPDSPRDCIGDDLGDIVRGGRVSDLVLGVHHGEAGARLCIVKSQVDPELDVPG